MWFFKNYFNPLALCLGLTLLLGIGTLPVFGQRQPEGEALLSFNYPAVGNVYVNAVFFGEVAYLPLGEMLSLLYIPTDRSSSGKGLQGNFPGKNDTWLLDPVSNQLLIKGKKETLEADKFYMGEMDLFLHPEYFTRIFGLKFSINIYALSASMTAEYPLPVEERRKREDIRRQLQQRSSTKATSVPLLYPRSPQKLALGVVDYSVNHTASREGNSTGILLNTGMELLGGDFQGTFNGNYANDNMLSSFSNMRWRYVLPGGMSPERNVGLASITAGQVNTTSFSNATSLLGVSITNNPVVPRMELDVFTIDGTTEPDSEVELLIGGQLVDFTRADEVGYYRFNAPVTYGTIRLTTRIYTPRGEVIIQERQLQIPFSFLPKGFIGYNAQVGLPQYSFDSLGTQLTAHGDIAYGITNALTVRAGVDHGPVFGKKSVYPVLGLSARVLQQYLLNVDALPDRYYRANASVFYASNTNINAQFTAYNPNSGFGRRGLLRDANLNVFYPFKLMGRFSGLRLSGERLWFDTGLGVFNYQVDFNTQISRVVARINYRGGESSGLAESGTSPQFQTGTMTASLTYTLPRTPGMPVYVKGMFLRAQMRYSTVFERPESMSFMVSQTLFKNGRFTFGYDKDLLRGSNQLQMGFLYDFNAIRSSTQYAKRSNGFAFQQSLSGSLAFEPASNSLLTSNRDQVTRAGASVRLFIDKNENGLFDQGEETVPAKAIRLDRSANVLIGSDGVLRVTQLQSYWKYKLDIDVAALPNPNLAPKLKSFSFVADPNHFKEINIPLYQTGIIEGTVFIAREGKSQGQGGLRLELFREGEEEAVEIIRTFSDGAYYAHGLIPGKYKLKLDAKQLEFMQVTAEPLQLEFEIKALADGDYLEGLDFNLHPRQNSENKALSPDSSDISQQILEIDPNIEKKNGFGNENEEPKQKIDTAAKVEKAVEGGFASVSVAHPQHTYHYPVVGSFARKSNALAFIKKLKKDYEDIYQIKLEYPPYYRVAIGRYLTLEEGIKKLGIYRQRVSRDSWILNLKAITIISSELKLAEANLS